MKFSEKYPNMRPLIDQDPNDIMRGNTVERCAICGESTEYIDIYFEAPVCSEECDRILNDEFIDAMLNTMEE